MEETQSLGTLIALVRKVRGLHQAELATALEVSVSTLSSWERDLTEPNASNLSKLCKRLAISGDVLLGNSPFAIDGRPVSMAVTDHHRPQTRSQPAAETWGQATKQARRAALNGQNLHNLMLTAKRRIGCPTCNVEKGEDCLAGISCMDRKMALACFHNKVRAPVHLDVDVVLGPFIEHGAANFCLRTPSGPVIACDEAGKVVANTEIQIHDLHKMSAVGWLSLSANPDDHPMWWIERWKPSATPLAAQELVDG